MMYRHGFPGGVWVDLEQPTQEEVHATAEEFSISERIESEMLSPSPSPIVAGDAHVAFIALHFPAHETDGGDTKKQEIDFIVGAHFIVTIRYEVIVPLHHLKKLLEAQEILQEHAALSADVLLEILFAHLYASARNHANHLADNLTRIEKAMYHDHGQEGTSVRAIASVSREFLHLESALVSQEEPLTRFLRLLAEQGFFGPSFHARAERILGERTQIARLVATERSIATDLRETNAALLETRQNEIIKILTVITFIALPLQLIASIFGMNIIHLPLGTDPHAFQLILGLMVLSAVGMIGYFASRRWI